MHLQALRYAAMVFTITFENAADAFPRYLKAIDEDEDGTRVLLVFLGSDSPDQDALAQEIRIVLVAAEFSKERTTAVLWLNSYELDIRCVRLKLYADNARILADVEQVLPLPEASEYQMKVGIKSREERIARATSRDVAKFDATIAGGATHNLAKRNAICLIVKYLLEKGAKPKGLIELVPWREGSLLQWTATSRRRSMSKRPRP